MSYPGFLEFIPSFFSAIAALFAALAAFRSLTVSRESKSIAEQSVMLMHHGMAATILNDEFLALKKELKSLQDISEQIEFRWVREIGSYSSGCKGGDDPRPLRHVLINGGKMLAAHSSLSGQDYLRAEERIYSIVREGMGETSDSEYCQLMSRADGTYEDFESVFGPPVISHDISESLAFRWVYYQLINRVSEEDWKHIWEKSWLAGGWLSKFHSEQQRLVSVSQGCLERLQREKSRLSRTVLPLEANPNLSSRYNHLISFLDNFVSNDCLGSISIRSDSLDSDDIVRYVLFSIGTVRLVHQYMEGLGCEA